MLARQGIGDADTMYSMKNSTKGNALRAMSSETRQYKQYSLLSRTKLCKH